MKLLFDENLSRRLCERLSDLFPASSHVVSHRLDRATDGEIWEFAKANAYCIVSQDADFAERSRLRGAPPKVVWMRCGNCTSERVEAVLRMSADLIQELGTDDTLSYVEIS